MPQASAATAPHLRATGSLPCSSIECFLDPWKGPRAVTSRHWDESLSPLPRGSGRMSVLPVSIVDDHVLGKQCVGRIMVCRGVDCAGAHR